MATAYTKATFDCDVKKVWDTVTAIEDCSWRSDVEIINIVSETRFTEISYEEYPTYFTVTACEPYKRWELDIENGNLYGHWTGIFSEEDGKATIEFTEEVAAKKLMAKPIIKLFLKKQQENYIADLRKAVNP